MTTQPTGGRDDDRQADGSSRDFQVLVTALRRWQQEPPISLRIQREEAWYLMSALQAVCSQPGLDERGRSIVEGLGRQIQQALVDVPELDAIVESGWRKE